MKKYLAELFGTFVLTLLGCGAAVSLNCGHDAASVVGTAIAFGLAVVAMAYTIGGISGCHINPAITLGVFLSGRMSGKDAGMYIIFQIIGAIIAAAVLAGIVSTVPEGAITMGERAPQPAVVVLLACVEELAAPARGYFGRAGKPTFTPHVDCGDYVIIVNAEKVVLTGAKLSEKKYYRHSGYAGHLKERTAARQLELQPQKVLEKSIRGMLPKNRLGDDMYRKLFVYAGPEHPHQAQKPEAYTLRG